MHSSYTDTQTATTSDSSTYTSEDPRSRRLLMCCPATPVAAAVARPLSTSYCASGAQRPCRLTYKEACYYSSVYA
jgi:hypothetical protein